MKHPSQSRWFYLILLLAFAVFLASVCMNWWMQKKAYLDSHVLQTERTIHAILDGYEKMADFIVHTEVERPEVLSLVAAALDVPTPAARDVERRRLQALLEPLYKEMVPIGFRQFHFHFPDHTSFLRLHRPEKYGDDLTGIRETVERTNADLVQTVGFEEGRIYNGYRFVYPLIWEGRHLGSVETSISLLPVGRELCRINQAYGDRSATFLLMKRGIVEAKVWEEERGRYGLVSEGDRYLIDARFSTIEDEKLFQIKETLRDRVRPLMEKGHSFAVPLRLEGDSFLCEFLPTKNISDHVVGYVVHFHQDESFFLLQRSFQMRVISLVLLGAFVFAFFFRRRGFYEKLHLLATTDPLTGVHNRRALLDSLNGMTYLQNRYGRPLSVVMFDVDHFKTVNDTYGHSVGDRVLKEITRLCRAELRESDLLARWGGDEFVIVLPETDLHGAELLAERVRARVADRFVGEEYDVTLSMGVCQGPLDVEVDPDRLFACVDAALYRAKDKGRNRVEVAAISQAVAVP